jgi:DNA-binding IclR family transcriptional regulator
VQERLFVQSFAKGLGLFHSRVLARSDRAMSLPDIAGATGITKSAVAALSRTTLLTLGYLAQGRRGTEALQPDAAKVIELGYRYPRRRPLSSSARARMRST